MDAKRTEDLTVAETLDAIFGEGTAKREFTAEELEIARQPYYYESATEIITKAPDDPITGKMTYAGNFVHPNAMEHDLTYETRRPTQRR